jgi:hypothetical protein
LNDVGAALDNGGVRTAVLERHLKRARTVPVLAGGPPPAPTAAAFTTDATALAAAATLFGADDEAARPEYLPAHLPPLPGKHTFVHSEVRPGGATRIRGLALT